MLCLGLGLLAASYATSAQPAYDPVASSGASVTFGQARFTVLTNALVRMELADSSGTPRQNNTTERKSSSTPAFEDRPTLAFVNRKLPVPHFTVAHPTPTSLVLETDAFVLTYTPDDASPQPPPPPPVESCAGLAGFDALCEDGAGTNVSCMPFRSPSAPKGIDNLTPAACCTACRTASDCQVWVHEDTEGAAATDGTPATGKCFLMKGAARSRQASNRTVGGKFSTASATGFTVKTLSVKMKRSNARQQDPPVWTPGETPSGNLLGTQHSLDGTTGWQDLRCWMPDSDGSHTHNGLPGQCSLAPISRDGWAIYEDATNTVVDPSTGWISTERGGKSRDASDIYMFAHGLDYKGALRDYSLVAGSVPRIPRFLLGVWWSRYWPYTAEDLLEIAEEYASHTLPIDTLVSDMAWHYHNESTIEWGGYAWSPELFPEHALFQASLKERGLNTVLNLHLDEVHYGADPGYFEFANKLGISNATLASLGHPTIPCTGRGGSGAGCGLPAPYAGSNVSTLLQVDQVFGEAYLDLLDSVGTDWWWLDDQPIWTARILFERSKQIRADGHGIAFSRWAGIGSHRYPIGFSGDTYMEWVTLQFQTSFTVAAANVLFWWSHDIGGHRSNHDFAAYDPELYLRWLQWGTHAPILRTHPQPDPLVERRPYGYALPIATYMGDAMRRRGQLVPTLASALRAFETTAVSPIRGLYIDYPEQAGAYFYNDTFVFCDSMVVAPVTVNVTNSTQMARRGVWLPPGAWVDMVDHSTIVAGGNGLVVDRNYTLWESPSWVRAGTCLSIAPQPTSDTAVGFASNADVASSIGWEVWVGNAFAGAGNVTTEEGSEVGASYTMSADGSSMTLHLNLESKSALSSSFFEIKGVFQASAVTMCSSGGTILSTAYSATTLTQSVRIAISESRHQDSHGKDAFMLCVKVASQAFSMLPPSQPVDRGGYVGRRMRAHKLKALMDDQLHNPQQVAMPLVSAVNSATRLDAACRRGNGAAAHAELDSFDASLAAALKAITSSHLKGQNLLSTAFLLLAEAWLAPY